MLLQRLVDYAQHHAGAAAFHRERMFTWQINLDSQGRLRSPELQRLIDPDSTGPKPRGVTHSVPAVVRTVGVAACLAADDIQYVLGWPDEASKPDRVRDCHTAFVGLIEAWAASPQAQDDPVAAAVARFYRDGGAAQITRPEVFIAKDGVVISVDGRFAHEAPSVAAFWIEEVTRRKGSDRHGLCLVCGQVRPLLDTVPGKIPARLVPGASNDAALVSVNEAVFGYDLSKQLTHTPLCLACGESITAGLQGLLGSAGSSSYSGQDSRLVWWVKDGSDAVLRLLHKPDITAITALLQTLHHPRPVSPTATKRRVSEKFHSLTVGGNVARVMVRDWVDMPLAEVEQNIGSWFERHQMVSRWPRGARFHSIGQLALVTGKWQPTPGNRDSGQYAQFGAKGSQRPEQVYRDLMRAALRGTVLPAHLLVHLLNRIRNDGHLDDPRAALLRLALTRPNTPTGPETPMPDLDETNTDPAYVSGRLFAAYEQLQRDTHYEPNPDGGKGTTTRVNVTFADRYFVGAISNPRTALLAGAGLAQAWLHTLHRRGRGGAAVGSQRRIGELYRLLDAQGGLPVRLTPQQQARFVIGYHHQRAHQFTSKSTSTGQSTVEETTTP
jgi:CRISPR-associated protein Csd1